MDAQILQAGRGQAGRVALLTQHEDLEVVRGDVQSSVTGRVEPPLQHVAFDHQGSGQLTLGGPLRGRPDVHDDGTAVPSVLGLCRGEPHQALAR